MSPTHKKIKSLEACRGFAALFVVLYHAGGAFAAEKYFNRNQFLDMFIFGSAGVQFFFVLSGFLIFYRHREDIGKPQQLGSYLWKRFSRIYPIYWVTFGFVIAAFFAVPEWREYIPDFHIIAKSLALVPQDPEIVGGTGAPVVIVAWSLQYEVAFYLLFAAFILSFRLGAFVVAGLAAWWLLSNHAWVWKFPFDFMAWPYFVNFVLGIVAAAVFRTGRVYRPRVLLGVAALCFAIIIASELNVWLSTGLEGRSYRGIIGYGVASALLIAGLAEIETKQSLNSHWALDAVGQSSYSLYLLHFPIISIACKIFSSFSGSIIIDSIFFVVTVLCCVLLSHVAFLMAERPMLRASRRIFLSPSKAAFPSASNFAESIEKNQYRPN